MLTVENLNGVSGIYCAIHRESGRCYVGSSLNVGRRRREHLKAATAGSMSCFHRALRQFGPEEFDLEILARCPQAELLVREEFFIKFYNSASIHGFNTVGIPTATYDNIVSSATRARISAIQKGRKKPAGMGDKLRLLYLGKPRPPEVMEKMRLGRLAAKEKRIAAGWTPKVKIKSIFDRPPSPPSCASTRVPRMIRQPDGSLRHSIESLARISKASKGRIPSPEVRKRMAEARRGKPFHDDAFKARLAERNRNRVYVPGSRTHSPETRAKMSAAGKGRVFSPEHRARLAASRLLTSANKKKEKLYAMMRLALTAHSPFNFISPVIPLTDTLSQSLNIPTQVAA